MILFVLFSSPSLSGILLVLLHEILTEYLSRQGMVQSGRHGADGPAPHS